MPTTERVFQLFKEFWHTDGQHRTSHCGAPLHQRACGTIHHRRQLEGTS